jgi:hypothetical protein
VFGSRGSLVLQPSLHLRTGWVIHRFMPYTSVSYQNAQPVRSR